MYKQTLFSLLLTLIFFLHVDLAAVEVSDLYVTKLVVNSKSDTDKKRVLKASFAEIILKVSGQESALKNNLIKKAHRTYYQYYTQFRYQKSEDKTLLVVTFDENKINTLLAQASLPIWGRLRPKVLIWFVNETGLSREVISETSMNYIPKSVHQFSEQRGVPMVLPLMDLTDSENIYTSDIWGRFTYPIEDASARYEAERIVVIRLSDSSLLPQNEKDTSECRAPCDNSNYALDWRFISSNVALSQGQTYTGKEPNKLLDQALIDITQQIYQRYAMVDNEQQHLLIDVVNIDSLKANIDVMDFLDDLSMVSSVTLKQVKGNQRRFNLTLRSNPDAFLATLKLHKALSQYVDPLADIDLLAPPAFLWAKP